VIVVGMPDSPYVRRVLVSLKLMGVPHEHQPVSVFRHFDRFTRINPVVKAPTLVCDDGTVLMDSTLILDHVESTLPAERRLMPQEVRARREALRLIGLAMAACEKCVQMVYEEDQRPAERRHEPWIARVSGQANAAFGELERAVASAGPWLGGARFDASDVAVACAWRFSRYYDDKIRVPAEHYPALVAYSARAEALPELASTPLD
jgi:glutathione S-transferase